MSSLTSAFGRVEYKGDPNKEHFLLLGDSEPDAIETFLSECFHSDHGKQETEIIMLRDSEPDEKTNEILKKPEYDQKLTYIKGSPLRTVDLKRCLPHKATCCIIMSNQSSPTPQQDDYLNIMAAFQVKRLTSETGGIRVVLQINKPEHKDLYYSG